MFSRTPRSAFRDRNQALRRDFILHSAFFLLPSSLPPGSARAAGTASAPFCPKNAKNVAFRQ